MFRHLLETKAVQLDVNLAGAFVATRGLVM
jgi:hypothetical protein